jgi:hypothetical protein
MGPKAGLIVVETNTLSHCRVFNPDLKDGRLSLFLHCTGMI